MATEHLVGFFAWETIGLCSDGSELRALAARLRQTTDIDRYRGTRGEAFQKPSDAAHGYTVITVLPELTGLPLCDLVLAYVYALHPTKICVSTGETTCDACPGRVTIYVDVNDVVTSIDQEVNVLYGCGDDIGKCLRHLKTGAELRPSGGVIGHTAGLERVDFT